MSARPDRIRASLPRLAVLSAGALAVAALPSAAAAASLSARLLRRPTAARRDRRFSVVDHVAQEAPWLGAEFRAQSQVFSSSGGPADCRLPA